jgi:cell volume regulation protein A
VAQGITSAFSIGIVLGILVGILWLKALKYIEEYDEVLTLAIVLLFYAITESLGGNGAIFTLFFGLVLGNGIYVSKIMKMEELPEENEIMKKFHSEISFMIMTFFFVYIGLMVVVEKYVVFFYGIILSFVVLLGRYVSTHITSIGEPFLKKNINVMRIMIPRALTPAVLAQLVVMSGIPNTELFPQIVIGVIITTVVISAVGISVIERMLKRNSRTEKEKVNHEKFYNSTSQEKV